MTDTTKLMHGVVYAIAARESIVFSGWGYFGPVVILGLLLNLMSNGVMMLMIVSGVEFEDASGIV